MTTNIDPIRNLAPCKSCCDGSFVFMKHRITGEIRLVCYSCYISFPNADAIKHDEPIGHIEESELNAWVQASLIDVESAGLKASVDDMK